jgi:hypothetical protein
VRDSTSSTINSFSAVSLDAVNNKSAVIDFYEQKTLTVEGKQ